MTSEPQTLSPDRATLVQRAAEWHSEQPPSSAPVPRLKEQFPELTTGEICEAIGLADRYRMLRSAMA
jgi:hypothetical protein